MFNLFFPVKHEIASVLRRSGSCHIRIVRRLFICLARYSIVFESGHLALARCSDIGADIVVVEVKPDVSIKIPV